MVDRIKRLALALREWRQFVSQDIWRVGKPGEKVPHSFLIKQVRVLILLVQQFVHDMLLVRAAALTFTTLLSLVPLLAILVYVVNTLEIKEEVDKRIIEIVFSGVPQEAGREFDAVAQLREYAERLGEKADESQEHLEAAGDSARENTTASPAGAGPPAQEGPPQGSNPRALGFMGVVFVIMIVFGLMMNIESAFNQIWGLRSRRSVYRMAADYLMVLILLPVAVALVFSMPTLNDIPWLEGRPVAKVLIGASNYLLVWLAFTLLYTVVPNTKVQLRYALFGGLAASILWGLAAWGYVELFKLGLDRYQTVYAAAAQIPMLFIWLFVSWVIVLFGAELVFAYQNEKTYAMERLAESASYAYREALALKTMVEMARRFDAGQGPLEPMHAAEEWNVPTRLLNDTLDQLADAGLVRPLATDPPTYQPGRSVERIHLADVVRIMREHGHDPSALRDDADLEVFADSLDKSLAEVSAGLDPSPGSAPAAQA